jgi:hypothetical protein
MGACITKSSPSAHSLPDAAGCGGVHVAEEQQVLIVSAQAYADIPVMGRLIMC